MLTAYVVLLKLGNKPETRSEKFQNWLSLLAKKSSPLPTHTLSGLGTDTSSVDLLWFHCPLPWWMKRRTCTKSGFCGLGPHLLCLPHDGCNLTVLPQFLTLRHIVLIWTFDFLFVAGLEPYVVHGQPGPDPVFPEHGAGVGPLYLSVVVGPFLLSSPLLPWPRSHSDVLPLHRQDGETSTDFGQSSVYCSRLFTWKRTQKQHFC